MYFIFIHALYIVSLMILHTFGTLPLGRINLISIPDGLSIYMPCSTVMWMLLKLIVQEIINILIYVTGTYPTHPEGDIICIQFLYVLFSRQQHLNLTRFAAEMNLKQTGIRQPTKCISSNYNYNYLLQNCYATQFEYIHTRLMCIVLTSHILT